jgi:hypothetical protein
MLSLILLISFFIFLFLWKDIGWRQAWIYSTLCWCLSALGISEFLSVSSKLDVFHLTQAWFLVGLISGSVLLRRHFKLKKPHLKYPPVSSLLLLIPILIIVLTTLFIAIKSTPNTWDSMTYHLSRIEHWVQNRNINFYQTHIERQLYMSPFAEIAMLQIRLLGGGNLVNLIQWFAMIGSLVCVSLIGRYLKLNSHLQTLTSLIAATIPSGIIQSTSTQNDYVVSFFVISFVFLLFDNHQKPSGLKLFFLGASLGLAVLTKPIACFYLAPFLLFFIISSLKNRKILLVAIVLSIAMTINLTHYIRLYSTYRNFVGPESQNYTVGSFAPKYIAANSLKNLSNHFGTPNLTLNMKIAKGISNISRRMNVDINDPNITWPNNNFDVYPLNTNECNVGNLFHLFLIIIFVTLLIIKRPSQKSTSLYILLSVTAFALVISLLRWQPWSSRFHLPFFTLMSPIIAIGLSKTATYIKLSTIVTLVLFSSYWLLSNHTRSLVGSDSIITQNSDTALFNVKPDLRIYYSQTASYLYSHDHRKIGLNTGGDSWEYPLWKKLHQSYGDDFTMKTVDVKNNSIFVKQSFTPDIIVCIDCIQTTYPMPLVVFGPIKIIPVSLK